MPNVFGSRRLAVAGNPQIRTPQREAYNRLVAHFQAADAEREVGIVLPVGCGKSGTITLTFAPNSLYRAGLAGGLALLPLLALLAWWWKGMLPSVATMGVGVALYLSLGRAYLHRRIERRVHERALLSLETWRKLWRFNGLTLAAKDRPGVADCASPDGNWMAFVRAFD